MDSLPMMMKVYQDSFVCCLKRGGEMIILQAILICALVECVRLYKMHSSLICLSVCWPASQSVSQSASLASSRLADRWKDVDARDSLLRVGLKSRVGFGSGAGAKARDGHSAKHCDCLKIQSTYRLAPNWQW